jgi:hypothetical protein
MNSPPIPIESSLTDAMAAALATLARTDSLARLHYQRPGGAAADRETGAELLTRTGLSSSVEQIDRHRRRTEWAACDRLDDPEARRPRRVRRFVYPGFAATARRIGARSSRWPR